MNSSTPSNAQAVDKGVVGQVNCLLWTACLNDLCENVLCFYGNKNTFDNPSISCTTYFTTNCLETN